MKSLSIQKVASSFRLPADFRSKAAQLGSICVIRPGPDHTNALPFSEPEDAQDAAQDVENCMALIRLFGSDSVGEVVMELIFHLAMRASRMRFRAVLQALLQGSSAPTFFRACSTPLTISPLIYFPGLFPTIADARIGPVTDNNLSDYSDLAFSRQFFAEVIDLLDNGATVLDIGAAIGLWTIHAAESPHVAAVHTFEPNPLVYEVLLSNVAAQAAGLAAKVTANQIACSNVSERGKLWVNFATGSRAVISSDRIAAISESVTAYSLPTTLISVDQYIWLKQIRGQILLRIDVVLKGFEILEGAIRTLQELRPFIYIRHNQKLQVMIDSWMANLQYSAPISPANLDIRPQGPRSIG